MPFLKKTMSSAAIAAMLTVSTAAAAAPANSAARLSLSHASGIRAGTPTQRVNHAINSTFINIGILAALVVVVLVATSNGDNSDSN